MNGSPARSNLSASTARLDASAHPAIGTPRWWASVNPVPANSLLLTTGTWRPWNGGSGWKLRGLTRDRASPERVFHRKTFITSGPVGPATTMRYPTIPWAAGGAPTVSDVKAVAVVEGTTDVIG